MNEALRQELVAMRAEDLRVREELASTGELSQGYAPRMEAVHRANAARLREIIDEHGWPDEESAGNDGAGAAWFIAQHAIGEPEFQRRVLAILEEAVSQGRAPAAHRAFLYDRIAMYEGRPQRYGTQYMPSADGQNRRWTTEDPERLNERRAYAGLPPCDGDPPETPPTPEALVRHNEWLRGYDEWLRQAGWR